MAVIAPSGGMTSPLIDVAVDLNRDESVDVVTTVAGSVVARRRVGFQPVSVVAADVGGDGLPT